MRTIILGGLLIAGVAHAGRGNLIYYNGQKFDDRYSAPTHFTGEKSYRDMDSGKVSSRETWVDGVLDGPFWHYEDDGKLDEQGNNRKGKRHGIFRRYQRGKLQMEMAYVDGELSGVQKDYRDGVLEQVYSIDPTTHGRDTELSFNKQKQLTMLKCGKQPIGKEDVAWCGMNGKQSTVTLYTDDGKTRATVQYLWGKEHGTRKSFNVATGAVREEVQYQNGKRVGETQRDASGASLFKSDCDNTRKGCTETEMFPGAKETKVVTVYKNGKTAERTENYQNGKLREHLVANGDHFQIDRFDDEGRPRSKGTYVFASEWSWQPYVGDGTVESFIDGTLWQREKLVRGSREGLQQEWWVVEGHKVRQDSECTKDAVTREKIYVDEKLAVTLEFMPDGSLKSRTIATPPPKGVIDI